MNWTWRLLPRTLVAGVLVAALLSGCGGGSDEPNAAGTTPADSGATTTQSAGMSLPAAEGEPQGEQSLNFVSWLIPFQSFDPAQQAPDISSEWVNLYGTLTRLNQDTGEYEPWMAESVEPNADASVWTVTLRDNVKFTDGEPYDADAVVLNTERALDEKTGARSPVRNFITSVKKTGPLTVEFTLVEPWTQFGYVLSNHAGLIAAPNYLAKVDAGKTSTLPVGAGPFKAVSWKPGSPLQTVANEDFWDGAPALKKVTFTGSGDSASSLDAFDSGQQDAVVPNPGQGDLTKRVLDAKLPGYEWQGAYFGNFLFNLREGRPFAKYPELRQAMSMGVNDTLLNTTVARGTLTEGKTIWDKNSPLGPAVAPYAGKYDPEEAKRLVDEAKSKGFDGKVGLLGVTGQKDSGVVFQSMMKQIGVELDAEYVEIAQFAERYGVKHDFDIAGSSFQTIPEAPWVAVGLILDSKSPRNLYGLDSPEMDQALDDLRVAVTDEDRSKAAGRVQQLWTESPPGAIYGTAPTLFVQKPDLKGATVGLPFQVYLDKAFRG